jgi:hypothetical protein
LAVHEGNSRSRLTVELLAPTSDFEADSKLAVFDIVLNTG